MFSEFLLIIFSIIIIIVSGLGFQCYNQKDSNKVIKNSMIGSVIFGIFGLFISVFIIYSSARTQGALNARKI